MLRDQSLLKQATLDRSVSVYLSTCLKHMPGLVVSCVNSVIFICNMSAV